MRLRSDKSSLLSDNFCCMFNLNVIDSTCIKAASNLHHTSRTVNSYNVCSCCLDVINLLLEDRSCDIRIQNTVCTAESTTVIMIFHLNKFNTLGVLKEFTLFLCYTKASAQMAAVMVCNFNRFSVTGFFTSAKIIEELTEVKGLVSKFNSSLMHLCSFLKEGLILMKLMCTGWTCGYDIIVFFCFHTFNIDFCLFTRIIYITHCRCRTSAACLAQWHLNKITNGVQVHNHITGKVCIYEIKRTSLNEFKVQSRGGVGKKGGSVREEDFIEHIYVANMHSTMLFFTEKGLCYRLKVYEIPEGSRTSKGRAVQNLLTIDQDDKIKTYLNAAKIESKEYTDSHFVVLFTKNGIIKRTCLTEFANVRSRNKGLIAISFKEGDSLLDAQLTSGNDQIMIAARNGRCVRFEESEARELGRNSMGVRGINIAEDDEVIGAVSGDVNAPDAENTTILVVSENGYGKRSHYEEYRVTARGAKGVKTLNITEKTGSLVAIKSVTEDNDIMIITRGGLTIRMAVTDISLLSRATQGVRLINLREGDSIAAVSVVAHESEEEGVESEGENGTHENEN